MASVHQRYRIIEKIDAGGMAEIYRGASISIEGFEKPVAIKRILPSLCENESFVAMFLDEARLTMQLSHANIVQIYDIGKADGTYFISMEMVEGWNLRRVMQRALDQNRVFPIAICGFIAMEVAKALAYAHEKNGPDGQSLGIVHRDVSPPNVLLSKEGEVKLTDFGLARAASNAQVSDHGVIKGKYAYLCPEAVEGKAVDPRADVYSNGIILWEVLCGRRLFAGKTDPETVELVRKGDVPKPSTVRPEIEPELDRIVLRALAKNPKRRYQSAREMEQDLAAYLFKQNMRVTSADLANLLREMDATGEVKVIDVAGVLRAELEEQVNVGRLDPTLGQVAVRPEDLKARSVSRVCVQGLLERLHDVPLDDLAEGGIHVSLADRLEGNDNSRDSQRLKALRKGKQGGLRRLLAAAAVALAAGTAVLAWMHFHH
jgi:serine/threonine-protein kinase